MQGHGGAGGMSDALSDTNIDPRFGLTIDLPLPPSANALFANAKRGRVKTKEYNSWLNEARWHVLSAWRAAGKPVAPDKVPMLLWLRVGLTTRHRDANNCLKAVEDVLVKELPIPDDRWNDRTLIERAPEFEGMCRVTIAVLNPPPQSEAP
jgi:Holliday junction resolvase RusA-like endonuclease